MTAAIPAPPLRFAAPRAAAATAVALALVLGPVQPAAADNGLVGGIVGGIIGGVIVNEANRNRPRTVVRSYRAPAVSSATREQNRETQVALNYFGFPVGAPDGALGARSRGAIAEYQAVLGYPATGELNAFERDFLVQSYYRAQSGGATVMNQIATDPRGARGLLVNWRDERLGVPGQNTATTTTATAPPPPAATPPVPVETMPQFGSTMAAATGSALPSFMGQGATPASLASTCNKVSLVTNSNGGFVTEASMTDPAFALSEQFCLARTYAIAQGEELTAKVAGFTPSQIAQQCAALGPVLKEHVAALSIKPEAEVVAGMSSFVLSSGMAPAQLGGTARICLGVGYVTDDMDVAIGSALILTTLGDKAYGELVGHHLMAGVGTAKRPDLALAWYDTGLEADATRPVFAPGMSDRPALIRAAAYGAAGRPVPGGAEASAPVKAGLPSFAAPAAPPANP